MSTKGRSISKTASKTWLAFLAMTVAALMSVALVGCGSSSGSSTSSSSSSATNSSSASAPATSDSGASTPAASSTSTPQAAPQPTPQALPATGEILSGSESYDSEITVHAPATENVYVKLKDAAGNDVLSFFVRAGETAIVGVPNGQYYAYFAMGTDWYGTGDLFGSSTSYSYDEEISDFSQYSVEYTLQASTGGNLSLDPVPASEF